MKKATKKEIEEIAEGWYKRAQKLAAVYKNPHSDPIKKQKALKLMNKMSIRLKNIALLLQQKPKSKDSIIMKPNSKPVKLIKL